MLSNYNHSTSWTFNFLLNIVRQYSSNSSEKHNFLHLQKVEVKLYLVLVWVRAADWDPGGRGHALLEGKEHTTVEGDKEEEKNSGTPS